MSSGFSVSDVLICSKLAFNAYNALKDSPKEFEGLRLEVLSLNATLRALAEEANSPNSIILLASPQRQDSLRILLENCSKGLQQLQVLTNKFPSLGSNEKTKFLEHVKFTLQNKNGPRDKLAIHTASINIFLTSLTHSSLGRLEGLIKNALRGSYQKQQGSQSQFSAGAFTQLNKDFGAFSTKSFATPSPAHAAPATEPSLWDIIAQDLEWERIRPEDVQPFKDEIVAYIRYLHKGGEPFWKRGTSDMEREAESELKKRQRISAGQKQQSTARPETLHGREPLYGRGDYAPPAYSHQSPAPQQAAPETLNPPASYHYGAPAQFSPPGSTSLSAPSAQAPQSASLFGSQDQGLQSQEQPSSDSYSNRIRRERLEESAKNSYEHPTLGGKISENANVETPNSVRVDARPAEFARMDTPYNLGNYGSELEAQDVIEEEKLKNNARTDALERLRKSRNEHQYDPHRTGDSDTSTVVSTDGTQSGKLLFGSKPLGQSQPAPGLFGAPPTNATPSSSFSGGFGAPSANVQSTSSPFGPSTGTTSGSVFENVSSSKPAITGLFGSASGSTPGTKPSFGQLQPQRNQTPSLFGQSTANDQEVDEMADLFDHMFDVDDAVPAIAQGAPIGDILDPQDHPSQVTRSDASRLSYPPNEPVYVPKVNPTTPQEHSNVSPRENDNQMWHLPKYTPATTVETSPMQSPTRRQLPLPATTQPSLDPQKAYLQALRFQLESLLAQLSNARRSGDARLEASLLAPSTLYGGESAIQVRVSRLRAEGAVVVNCDLCRTPVIDMHWHCDICAGGDWDCCVACEVKGMGCPGVHAMAERSAKAWAGPKYWSCL